MEYQSNLKGLALFELKSWFGRHFIDKKPKLFNKNNYLNLGCGGNTIDGYVNADFFYGFRFWKKNIYKREWQLDLRYKLVCQNEVFDGIYSEHTLEHLYPSEAERLLKELYRVLKKDSIIRITVPDIEKYINYYCGNDKGIDIKTFNEKYQTRCSAIRNITQNYFHVSTWDFEELKSNLEAAGFTNIKKMSFNESEDGKLKLDREDRSWETLYVEAHK